ncbi:hypothetical protein HYT00_01725 [Candidatus Giovannonibacteria bacterium]|nr:hypothetical protein [Candidatus Giovannonibacteria bacterium]
MKNLEKEEQLELVSRTETEIFLAKLKEKFEKKRLSTAWIKTWMKITAAPKRGVI